MKQFVGHLVVEVIHGNKEDMCLETVVGSKFTMSEGNKIRGTQISMRMGRLKDLG
jgi:hypothetical protein